MPATMRAARMHAVGGPMSIDTIAVPKPGSTDVLVEGRAERIHEWRPGHTTRVPLWPVRPAFLRVGDAERPHGLSRVAVLECLDEHGGAAIDYELL